MRRKRTVAVFSLLGMGWMALGALRQIGIIKRLPDPPGDLWDTNKVVTSDAGYPYGVPDSPIALVSLATNVVAATVGEESRAEHMPLVPIAAAGKCLLDVAASGWYVSRMARKEKAWCPYCLATTLTNLAIAGLVLPEAIHALRHLGKGRGRR